MRCFSPHLLREQVYFESRHSRAGNRPFRRYSVNKTANTKLRPYAQKLRHDMTKEERHLWYDFLKSLSVTVRRQHVIGSYIVDFYIASAKLVIELDGSQHYEDTGIASDQERDHFLASQGLRVLRFSNLDIHRNFNGVCEEIMKYL